MRIKLYIYIFLIILFAIFTYAFVDVNFIYLKRLYSGLYLSGRELVSIIYLILIVCMFLVYEWILLSKKIDKIDKKILLIPLIGIFAYPAALSFDMFNYIATAKVAFHYFENPYIVMPIELVGEPILVFTRATNKIALYGPFWTLISGMPLLLSFGSYLLSILLFKTLVSVFYFGIIWLIYKITKSYSSVLFFAANPLIIIEIFVSGHNDVVMIFFALFSIYSLRNKKYILAILFLLVSIMIKYATIFLVPLFVYYLYKHIRKQQIDWNKFYFLGFILILIIFFLSPIREEIYPWYAIWFLPFAALLKKKIVLKQMSIAFSFGLLLSYIPYMFIGDYLKITLFLKYIAIIIPLIMMGLYIIIHGIKKNA